MSFKGRKNVYTCNACGWQAVTVDVDEGVTPFMIGCEREGCDGDCYSAFYQLPPGLRAAQPTHEWYRPDAREAKKLGRLWRDHLQGGGLKLRPRVDPPAEGASPGQGEA